MLGLRRVTWLACLALSLPLAAHGAVDGEGKNKSIAAIRASTPPVIDGDLTDAVWLAAPSDDRFTQTFPEEGKPPSERTEVRVLYDDDNLYVGVHCFDSNAAGVSERLTRRDRDIETDWLALYIDSRHDHNSGLVFQLSAAGVQVDGQFFDDSQYNSDWDGVWNGAVKRDSAGWHTEFAIPLTVLRFSDLPVQEWGFNVHRNVSRKREQMMWIYSPSTVQGMVSRWGHISDLRGLEPRRTFELRPYAVSRVRARSESGGPFLGLQPGTEFEPSWDAGLDLKLGLTSRLTLDATINPDFGQVEADQVVLNLSRFETFFPEKRPFFLEGREVFETPLTMFYPRRIGRPPTQPGEGSKLYENGEELTVVEAPGSLSIWGAGKVTGGIGTATQIGVLAAVTGAENIDTVDMQNRPRTFEASPERSWVVLRARHSFAGGRVMVGAAGTAVNRLGGGHLYRAASDFDAYSQGIDGSWTSEAGRLRVAAQAVLSERIGGSRGRTGAGLPCENPDNPALADCLPIARADGTRLEPGSMGYGGVVRVNASQGEHIWLRSNYTAYSPKLDLNVAGFQPEFNTHHFELIGGWVERRPGPIFRNWNIIPILIGNVSFDGVPEQVIVGADFEAMLKNFVFTSPQLVVLLPGMWDRYETLDGARFAKTSVMDFNWFVGSNPAKDLSGGIRVMVARDLNEDGRYAGVQINSVWRPMSNLELAVDPEARWEAGATRFYDCTPTTAGADSCLEESGTRNYRFADLESRFLSITFRATYTLLTTLSLQSYVQWFVADGKFSDYRETSPIGAHPYIERDDLDPSTFNGDNDGDGIKDDDFEFTDVNVNVVLRWEPAPGSQLFMVYTRAQQAGFAAPSKLDTGPTDEVVLVKFQYFL